MLENGHTTARSGESINAAIRRLNNEGWRVMQVITTTNPVGFLLERVVNK